MDWADKLAEKIGERCTDLSPADLDFIADTIRERIDPLLKVAEIPCKTALLSAELAGFNTDAFLDSKGDWFHERSSGYAGFRCKKCGVWVYADQKKQCYCDVEPK
jgi:hypothetical protein